MTLSLEFTSRSAHKSNAANVWIQQVSPAHTLTLSGQYLLPEYGQGFRFADFMELERQIGMIQAHDQIGISTDDVFILEQISLTWLGDVPSNARSGTIHVSTPAEGERMRSRLKQKFLIIPADRGFAAIGQSSATALRPKVYQRLRGGAVQSRHMKSDEALAGSADPLTSDHTTDHVSAMQIISEIEAQLRVRQGEAHIRSLVLDFSMYVENDAVRECVLHLGVEGHFEGAITVNDSPFVTFSGVRDLTKGRRIV